MLYFSYCEYWKTLYNIEKLEREDERRGKKVNENPRRTSQNFPPSSHYFHFQDEWCRPCWETWKIKNGKNCHGNVTKLRRNRRIFLVEMWKCLQFFTSNISSSICIAIKTFNFPPFCSDAPLFCIHVLEFAILMSSQFELEYVKIQDNEENNYFLISDFSSHLMFSCVFRMFNYLWAPSSSSVIILPLFIIMDYYWA